MRLAPILLPLALCAAPAIAQPKPIQLPPELTDPAAADRLADAMQAADRHVPEALARAFATVVLRMGARVLWP